MAEKINVPEIRFAGFIDPWEQRKLGDCFDFLHNNTLSRADLNSESGSARNIHYGDILIKFGDCLGLDSGKLPFADDESILSKYANSTLRIGDVIFADTAEDESAGKCVELVKLPNEPVISGLHTIPARPKFPFGSGYLGHYLNAPAYHDQLLPLMQGIKVVSISKTALQDTQICFPTALEQSAIGTSLNALDSLITLHQRKFEKLVQLKKSMLDKMFPKPGERFPEIRFAGFTDPWEQRKVGELTTILSAVRVHKEEWRTAGVPFYRSSDVMAAFKGTENERVFISQELFEQLSAQSGAPQKGDVMVTGGGSVGTPYIVPDNKPLYTKDADLIWIKRHTEINPKFLYSFFISPIFKSYIRSISHVGTIAHYTIEQVKETPLLMPCSIVEQKAIGSFLGNLDSLITLHQRKLELLRNTKKSLLDRMFV